MAEKRGLSPVLIEPTGRGLYCAAGDFYVDPWQPVERAVITHAHGDHARPGHASYLCAKRGLPVLRTRMGEEARIEGVAYGETRSMNGVKVALHPAGHAHGAVEVLNRGYRECGIALPETRMVTDFEAKKDFAGALIVAPPSAQSSPWLKRFGNYSDAFASGWMAIRGARRRRVVDKGFVLSDHADWPSLNRAIDAAGAARVFVTHGHVTPLVQWLNER